jgi:hypothetical protein
MEGKRRGKSGCPTPSVPVDRENLRNHLRLFGLLILKHTGGEPNFIGRITLNRWGSGKLVQGD